MTQTSSFTILGIVGLGMGFSFLFADWRTPTSRALALLFAFFGANMFLNALAPLDLHPSLADIVFWSRLFALNEALNFVAAYEWLLRIRRTEAASASSVGKREGLLRAAQAIAVFHGAVGFLFPNERYLLHTHWVERGTVTGLFTNSTFWFAGFPIYLSITLAAISIVQLVLSRPDSVEVVRLVALAVATPFWISGMYLPHQWQPSLTAIGVMIFLAGSIRYHVLQGQRAQFLGRFVSPDVARLVREQGLERALQRTRLDISALVCDLRGFTRFSEAVSSDDVTQLLEEFYDVVGSAVADAGGTIKDHAGDGVLAIFGAPVPLADHAERAVKAARTIRQRTVDMLQRWTKNRLELGIGIGIASGPVTVGAIGGATRLEYVAVGPAVNLASRLCDHAASGEILVDQRVAALAGSRASFEERGSSALPGFSEEVPILRVGSG